jgi:hypothetical protein
MTTLARHFAKLLKRQQKQADEICAMYDHNHIKHGQEQIVTHLSYVMQDGMQEIERAKMLLNQ